MNKEDTQRHTSITINVDVWIKWGFSPKHMTTWLYYLLLKSYGKVCGDLTIFWGDTYMCTVYVLSVISLCGTAAF